ncbi:MAG: hypothetical protein C4316_11430, partial [Chloroflexota bacterium]
EPILLPVAVVARFWPDPAALLVLQTVVVASGALSAFGFAYRRLGSELAALTFAAAYLLAPELDAAVLAEFHPVAMASAFLMHALYFYSAGQKGPFLLFAFLAAGTKEQVPLAVGLLGLRAAVRPGWRQLGLRVAAAGILWFGLATFVVIPLHNPAGASPYLSRYDHLGGSPVEIIKTILGRPEVLLQEAQNPVKAAYLLTLFRPVVFLPFLAPVTLLPALPDLLLNLLSTFEPMFRGGAHYSAVIVPFVIGAAVDGLDVLRRLAARVRPDLGPRVVGGCSALVLISAAHAYVADVLLPLYDRLPVVTPHDRLAPEVLKVIPEDAPVSAGNSLNPHLAARRRLYLFPEVRDAEYVAVDVTASPYPVDAGTQYWQLQALLNGGEWGVAAARDGYLVLVRGSRVRELPEEFFTFALAGPDEKYEPVGAVFAPGLRLVGYRLEPGTVLRGRDPVARLVTFWQAEGPIREDVRLVFRLVGPDGRVLEDRPYQAATLWLPPQPLAGRKPYKGRGQVWPQGGAGQGPGLGWPSGRVRPTHRPLSADGAPGRRPLPSLGRPGRKSGHPLPRLTWHESGNVAVSRLLRPAWPALLGPGLQPDGTGPSGTLGGTGRLRRPHSAPFRTGRRPGRGAGRPHPPFGAGSRLGAGRIGGVRTGRHPGGEG